jgi:hypothetical protein
MIGYHVSRRCLFDLASLRSTTVSMKFHTMNAYASYSLAFTGSVGGGEVKRYGRSSPVFNSSKYTRSSSA